MLNRRHPNHKIYCLIYHKRIMKCEYTRHKRFWKFSDISKWQSQIYPEDISLQYYFRLRFWLPLFLYRWISFWTEIYIQSRSKHHSMFQASNLHFFCLTFSSFIHGNWKNNDAKKEDQILSLDKFPCYGIISRKKHGPLA